jgi:hypothetical protein
MTNTELWDAEDEAIRLTYYPFFLFNAGHDCDAIQRDQMM